jgi:hypothetical protein
MTLRRYAKNIPAGLIKSKLPWVVSVKKIERKGKDM